MAAYNPPKPPPMITTCVTPQQYTCGTPFARIGRRPSSNCAEEALFDGYDCEPRRTMGKRPALTPTVAIGPDFRRRYRRCDRLSDDAAQRRHRRCLRYWLERDTGHRRREEPARSRARP